MVVIDDKLIQRHIELMEAYCRCQHDLEDADDCRSDGWAAATLSIYKLLLKNKQFSNCPSCGEKSKDIFTHICYQDTIEDGECYACGEESDNRWKHAMECKENRELM